ncbi:hypothetical protein Ddc_21231 [Ditylenchus destructor]|nr:hypothetical protein Ddc_21231 [Ditylenchus destructor]
MAIALNFVCVWIFIAIYVIFHQRTAVASPQLSSPVTRHNLTMVTAIYDIFSRGQSDYRANARNVLRLKIPAVIFVDEKNYAFVKETRDEYGLSNITKVHRVAFEELPLFSHKEDIEKIQQRELAPGRWKAEWDKNVKNSSKMISAEYVVLDNSKPYFLCTAKTENFFTTEFFVWIDADFSRHYPEKWARPGAFDWYPTFPQGKITMLKTTTQADKVRQYKIEDLYHKSVPEVLSPRLIGGDYTAITKFYKLFYEELDAILKMDMVEDEWITIVLVAAKHIKLFNFVERDCGPTLNTTRELCTTEGDAFDLLRHNR